MFRVTEISNLNNDDFSFLDDVCLSEDNLGENKNMANFDLIEGTSFAETNVLSEDWLSGNVQLSDLTEQSNNNEPGELNDLYSTYLDTSHSIYSSSIEGSPSDVFGACSSVDEYIQIDELGCEEIYSSTNEVGAQLDLEHAKSSMASESDETSLEQNNKDDFYNLAGKKYLQMREKNNIASRRSRKLRKEKDVKMVERLKKLEIENKQLSLLVTKLEMKRDALQKLLLQTISKK